MAISVDDGPVSAARSAAEPGPIAREKFWNLPNTITVVRVGVVRLEVRVRVALRVVLDGRVRRPK